MRPRSRRLVPIVLLLSGTTGCNLAPPIDLDAAVLVLPAGGQPATMFFTVNNRGNADVAVTAVTVEPSIGTELQSVTAHRMPGNSSASGTRSLMRAIDRVEVPKHARVSFAPGGYTVVVRTAPTSSPSWQRGDTVRFTVHLSSAWSLEGRARVVTFAEFDGADTSAASDASRLADGHRLYRGNGCAHCHGLEGAGDGPLAATLQPPPRNFRAMPVFVNGKSPDGIAQTLATGLPAGGSMPLYPHLNRTERLAIAHYVLSLADSAPGRADTPDTPAPHGDTTNRSHP